MREDAASELARVKFADQLDQEFDWASLSSKHRAKLRERVRVVRDWGEHKARGARQGRTIEAVTTPFLALLDTEGLKVSRSTLFGWERCYRQDGVAGLVDGRWRHNRTPADDPFLDEVKRLWLLPRRLKLQLCIEMAAFKAEEQGWIVRSYSTCKRCIDTIPEAVKAKQREGGEAFTNKAEPFIERNYTTIDSNDVWCSDHHPFDVMVRHRGKHVRPWLTVWEDMRSRKIVGWLIRVEDPDTEAVLGSFRDGVMHHGVPVEVYVDNGRDYQARALSGDSSRRRRRIKPAVDTERVKGVFEDLGVCKTFCIPYHPQSKPVERFFTTVEARFGVTFETYTGGSPGRKPADLQRHLDRGHAPTLEEFISAFADWLEDDYHQRVHRGDGMDGRTPAEVFDAHLVTKRTASLQLLNLLCLKSTPPLKVTRNGVRTMGVTYDAPELWQRIGDEVTLRIDERDCSSVMVFDLEDRLICIAEEKRKLPFKATGADLKAAHREKARVRRKAKEYHRDVRPRLADDIPDLAARAARQRAAQRRAEQPNPTPPAPSLQPVRSKLESEVAKVERAKANRKAALAQAPAKLLDVAEALRDGETAAPEPEDADPFAQLARNVRAS